MNAVSHPKTLASQTALDCWEGNPQQGVVNGVLHLKDQAYSGRLGSVD
jgi:hypothetical protein